MVCNVAPANVKLILSGRVVYVRALIDAGTPVSRISEALASRLRLRPSVIDGREVASLEIKGRHGCNDCVEAIVRITVDYQVSSPVKSLDSSVRDVFPGLTLADSRFYESTPIELVLGLDVYAKIVKEGMQKGRNCALIAQYSIFGFMVSGVYHL